MTDHRTVAKWLTGLSMATRGAVVVTKEEIGITTALLGQQFPDAAYTLKSMEAIASQSPFWPSYNELLKWLGDWWKDNAPPSTRMLSDETMRDWDEMDRKWHDYFFIRQGENFSPVGESKRPSSRQHLLSLIREQSPKAWSRITGQPLPKRHEPTDEQRDYLANRLGMLRGGKAA